MNESTTVLFMALQAAMAASYRVTNVSQSFKVDAPMATRLNDAIQQSNAFLQRINLIPVDDSIGQAVLVDAVGGPLASRTDTSKNDRQTTTLADPDGYRYECVKTDWDVDIPYTLLDTWARYPDFQQRYMNQVYRRIGLDRIMVGWHGEQVARESDKTRHPLLQDINIGWIKQLQTRHASNYMTDGNTKNEIKLGPSGDYKNLDQMVYDVYSTIAEEKRTGSEVAIIGQKLVTFATGKMLEDWAAQPTEKVAIKLLDKAYGGLPAMMVPHFPDMGVVVTDLRNLSIYFQNKSVRRKSEDNPRRDCIEDYNSMNDAYMIENPKAMAAVHAAHVKLVS